MFPSDLLHFRAGFEGDHLVFVEVPEFLKIAKFLDLFKVFEACVELSLHRTLFA